MKVSINLAQEFSNVDLKSIPRNELLQRIGAQLGAVEDVVDWAPKLAGALIAKVIECEKHPNADKLSVCRIDDGGNNQDVERGKDGLIQVVCGAPNVRAGMYAVWLPPGVTVPSTRGAGEPFVLSARDLRGVVSSGMLSSASELGISDDHAGIVEVTAEDAGSEPAPGEPLTNYFGLDDFVVDCENKMFTHRPDCFGNLGVAREIAGISGLEFKSPDWYLGSISFKEKNELPLTIANEATEFTPRFMTVAMKGIEVKPSPFWLQATLARVGIKPINNVVDVTNYVMHLTAQPLHAFDYDKVKAKSDEVGIFPRISRPSEKLSLLSGKEIELTGEEIIISTDREAVALAGVMGGSATEVSADTKNIIIECATFDMYSIRRTSMRHGLFTDAVTRYSKGQSPQQNPQVLALAMKLLGEVTGAQQASPVLDVNLAEDHKPTVVVSTGFINKRLGLSLTAEEMKTLLCNVEFNVIVNDSNVHITPPFWRMDINLPEDIVEEIGRLYGYGNLPVNLPGRTVKPVVKNQLFELKKSIRHYLSGAGANEVLTYSFVHGDLLRKCNIDSVEWAYHIRNAISPDLQYYRPSLVPSLLAKIHPNIKAQAGSGDNQFALFEIGKAHMIGYLSDDGLPEQAERLALVVAADDKTAKAHQLRDAYYLAKKYVDLLTKDQAEFVEIQDFNHPLAAPFAKGRSAEIRIEGQVIGVVGEFAVGVRRALKLPDFSAGLELDIQSISRLVKDIPYQPLASFPGTHQDYTHEVLTGISWQEARDDLESALSQVNKNSYAIRVEPIDIFAIEELGVKRYTFRILLYHPDRTLRTEEASRLIDEASRLLSENLKISGA